MNHGALKMTVYAEVGAYEAKTHLADFLRKVKAGLRFYARPKYPPVPHPKTGLHTFDKPHPEQTPRVTPGRCARYF